MPKIGNESRHQIHSLLSLVMSTLILTVSFTSAAVEAKANRQSLLIRLLQMSEEMDLMRM